MSIPGLTVPTTNIPSPSLVFGGIGMLSGVSDESQKGAFHDKQFYEFGTDRVSHEGDGVWRFQDPEIGFNFLFTQDRQGNYNIQDPETGEWQPQDGYSGIGWNLNAEQMKVYGGGGSDDEWNTGGPWTEGYDREKKDLPLGHTAMGSSTTGHHNPVTPERIQQAREFKEWEIAQKERNNQAMLNNPFPGGFNMADAIKKSEESRGKSYWETSGTPKPPVRPSGVPDWLLNMQKSGTTQETPTQKPTSVPQPQITPTPAPSSSGGAPKLIKPPGMPAPLGPTPSQRASQQREEAWGQQQAAGVGPGPTRQPTTPSLDLSPRQFDLSGGYFGPGDPRNGNPMAGGYVPPPIGQPPSPIFQQGSPPVNLPMSSPPPPQPGGYAPPWETR